MHFQNIKTGLLTIRGIDSGRGLLKHTFTAWNTNVVYKTWNLFCGWQQNPESVPWTFNYSVICKLCDQFHCAGEFNKPLYYGIVQ